MLVAGGRIEAVYGHLFDSVIVNDDLVGAFETLLRTIRRLDQVSGRVRSGQVRLGQDKSG